MKKKDVWVMGVSGLGNSFHDNSVCLVKNGKVVFAASEERYTRIKHDSSFPSNALKAAFNSAGIKRSEVDLYASGWPRLSLIKALLKVNEMDLLLSGFNFLKHSPAK
ncbi:hypothetical protein IID22_04895, partial [Patescibacteria group bacterium]|nr:hypothetical protein [Patescibacteria group bacterium]